MHLQLYLVTFYEYFLKPISVAILLKHCRQRFNPYEPMCAPNLPQRSHFFVAIPIFLSFGLLCLVNFAATSGLFFNWLFNVFFQSLAVILFEFRFEIFLHEFYYFFP